MYKILNDNSIEKDGAVFPKISGNRHYNDYLKWIAEGNMPEVDENSLLKIQIIEAKPDRWVKENEQYQLLQPILIEAHWSNGIDSVADADDIPTLLDNDSNPYLDPEYVYVPVQMDDSWAFAEATSQTWIIVDNQEKIAEMSEISLNNTYIVAVESAMNFGQKLIVQFAVENIRMGITQDGMTKHVRKTMSEVASALQTGSLYDAIDEISLIPEESKDNKYITDARLQEYKVKIQQYLGL